ncbi:MAG: hypothetical protein Q8M11_22250 [Sulfuritalea sp.]|nr:hypothetical protein [Sulfuritalea sp.]
MKPISDQYRSSIAFAIAMALAAPCSALTASAEAPVSRTAKAAQEPHFTDQCVGGTAHELVAQANILIAQKYPEYGLSKDLAIACLRFVWVVLHAESLDAASKRKVFAGVRHWSGTKRLEFFVPLKRKIEADAEAAWQRGLRP